MAAQQRSSSGASARPSTTDGARTSSRSGSTARTDSTSRWGTLVPLGIVVLGLVELAILVLIGINTSLWWAVLAIAVGWVIGIALLVAAGQQSFVRLRSLMRAVRGRGDVQEHLSRPAFTLLSALFFFFPGILTDLIGVVLLLTPVQRRSVKAMGLSSGSEGARKVLYRRSGTGVIDGEIILDSRSTGSTRNDGGTPPTLTQDPDPTHPRN
ncbi:FxsA family protein [Brachybacterium paraconglomeratum]|uniref:FxsA family protein n=1 Tax=Brachybacterium paraconglomeratum TaxID=173362 RepID=UPI0031E91D55